MRTWIDRSVLIEGAETFASRHGFHIRQNAKRISSLAEIAVYNSFVEFYVGSGFTVEAKNLGPKKSFKYKLSASGLNENFSYFRVTKDKTSFSIMHNTSVQSAHHRHLYYTADVVVLLQVY